MELTLSEYNLALPTYCNTKHSTNCKGCTGLQAIVSAVLKEGYIRLSDAFRMAFPGIIYHSHSAKSRILQLPLAALRLGNPDSGNSEVYLIEHSPGNNYHHILDLMTSLLSKTKAGPKLAISKEELKDMLRLAGSDRENASATLLSELQGFLRLQLGDFLGLKT